MYAEANTTVLMFGSMVELCQAGAGGSIHIGGGSTLLITLSKIQHSKALTNYGGALSIDKSGKHLGKYMLHSSAIEDAVAAQNHGGAVSVLSLIHI